MQATSNAVLRSKALSIAKSHKWADGRTMQFTVEGHLFKAECFANCFDEADCALIVFVGCEKTQWCKAFDPATCLNIERS